MGLTYQIPHTAHYFTKTNIFTANFNVPLPGQYSFNVTANQNLVVTPLQKNKVYLIDRISIGGTASESDYLDSLDSPANLPNFRLKRQQNLENVYFLPYSVVNYLDDSEVTAWVLSEKANDFLLVDFFGVLNQIPSFIGVASVKIHITFSIFIISSTIFYGKFRDALSSQTGEQVSGSIDNDTLIEELRELINVMKGKS